MASGDRLSPLDTSFLYLEDGASHMHVGSVLIFEGAAPAYRELVSHVDARLDLVPRYRQRLAFVPLQQGRPVWVDDPHFNLTYHVRHTALPAPGGRGELERLAGRLFSQQLDRTKPLWEIWLVEGLEDGNFALIAKTHHCLVDGVSGVDLTTVIFDLSPDAPPPPASLHPWTPRPLPTAAQLLADALLERATVPGEIGRGVRSLLRTPRQILSRVRDDAAAVAAFARGGLDPAPPSPLNVDIGPHRRFTWVDASLDQVKAIKSRLGGTVNDVVLTVVALSLGRYLRDQAAGDPRVRDLEELRAMVPVSVRADVERGALGNRVAAVWAPLPVAELDPVACFERVRGAMSGLKDSGQAVGAEVLTELAGFAPPTIMAQAARLQSRQRFFNLVVTNVPGPQFPLYVLGRRLLALEPQVPLAKRQALGVAIMSYNGRMHFGLLADYDAVPDLQPLAAAIESAIRDLAAAAGLGTNGRGRSGRGAPRSGGARSTRGRSGAATGRRPTTRTTGS
jgi:WS/DGAT/MGAT family acyltransferase